MAICSTQSVKDFLKLDDTSRDTQIVTLIPAAQSFIEEYCRRVFEKAEVTEYHHGGSNRILIKRYPIVSTPAPIVWDDWDRDYETDDIVDADDYFVDYDNGIFFFDYELGKGYGSIKVKYTGGYTTVPEAVRQACVELVARKIRAGAPGDTGVVSKGMPGGTSVTFSTDGLLPETKLALDLFKRELSE